jgi:hypothetical protein
MLGRVHHLNQLCHGSVLLTTADAARQGQGGDEGCIVPAQAAPAARGIAKAMPGL